ncbi:NB-ARC domain-containing protein [Dactylosporangium sp. NPDC049140]|uniref:NB-ARC domain-containing protein n=1 Tax=Dactylosporangium sp. NPDC049140 TaxID=3155647 RepID=UPI0033ECC110
MCPIQALAGLLRMLGVAPERVPVDEAEAAALYRSTVAGRRVLVLLDNARSAEQVRPLLPGSPGCLVLITSRHSLNGPVAFEGARRVGLDVLEPDEADQLLCQLVGEARVRAEPEAGAQLARLCAYLPLALRVAGASLSDQPDRSIARYVADLTDRGPLSTLAVDDDEAPVRFAFDLSYREESEANRRVFRLLGLVPGPDVMPPALAAIAAIPLAEAERALARLASVHLLQRTGAQRFSFHDLLRSYARERAYAEEPDHDDALRRLFDWYLVEVDAAARMMYPNVLRVWTPDREAPGSGVGFDDAEAASRWLDAERYNLFAAIFYSGQNGPPEVCWLLADALRGYLAQRVHLADWFAIATVAFSSAQAMGNSRSRASAHLSLAHAHYVNGAYQRSKEELQSALTLSLECGWLEYQATCLGNLGAVLSDLGHLSEAIATDEEAIALGDRVGVPVGGVARANHAYANIQMGRPHAAREYLRMAQQGGAEMRFTVNAGVFDNLAMANHVLGEDRAAVDHLRMAIAMKLRTADTRGVSRSRAHMAVVHHDAGRAAEARQSAEDSLQLARESGEVRARAAMLAVLGAHHLAQRDLVRAGELNEEAIEVARSNGLRLIETQALIGLGAVKLAGGDPARGHSYALSALDQAAAFRMGLLGVGRSRSWPLSS